MSNELVTFGRVPKSTMGNSPKVAGKLWVTDDITDNPDNDAEAYIDDTSSRRMKITDRDLKQRVKNLEDSELDTIPITEEEILEIVRQAGGDPASPLNFKNNIMFCDSEIDDSDAIDGDATISLIDPTTSTTGISLPNLETPYNLIIVTYPNSFPNGMYSILNLTLQINSDAEDTFLVSNYVKGMTLNFNVNSPSHCFTEGTYVFHITVDTNNTITVNKLYVFPKKNLIVGSNGKNVGNQNTASLLSYNITSESYLFGNVSASNSLSYIETLYGAYLIAITNEASIEPDVEGAWNDNISVAGNLYSFVNSYMNIQDLNTIVLPVQSGISYKTLNVSYGSVSPQSYLTLKVSSSGTVFNATLNIPNNSSMGNSVRKLIFFLPKF